MNPIEIISIIASIIALAIAVIGHEIMHGYIAYKYGDNTAKSLGRLSINPIVHIDLVGTILLPAILYITGAPFIFGWAKPVPINANAVVRNGGYGAMIAVALAGITFNLILAIFLATIYPLVVTAYPDSMFEIFINVLVTSSIKINIILAVFNLWPIPPLDGSLVLRYLAEKFKWYNFIKFYDTIYPYGTIILFAILFIPYASYYMLYIPANWILNLII